MSPYNLILENIELFRLFYTIIIGFCCVVIVFKTDKLFQLSSHQGIRYFRNAFFFYGLAFISRYFFMSIYLPLMKIVFEFFLIMAGFFLVYSLLWKRFEIQKDTSSLFNSQVIIFYIFALILTFLDYLWEGYNFMFISQIILFLFAVLISYVNYQTRGGKGDFLKFYLIAMILNLIAWISNFSVVVFFKWYPIVITVHILNVIIFLIFLGGVIKITKKGK